MRLTRRALLAGAAVAGAGLSASAVARPQVLATPTAIAVRTFPLDHFSVRERERREFGSLRFRAGLELQASDEAFGGFSGLWRSPDGARLIATSDNAAWFTARLDREGERLTGLSDTVLAPVLGANGRPLRGSRSYDIEALTIVGGTAYVGIERTQEIMRFDAFGREGVAAKGQPIALPREVVREWPRNKGVEAIGLAPAGSPVAGSLVVIAERARPDDDAPTQGIVVTGPRRGVFDVARKGEFDATDLAFLPGGDLLLLERRFSVLRGPGCRIRRIPAELVAPGRTLDGPVLFEADAGHQIDNMEGLALHRGERGETILTLISDNNFSILQRTLLLEFTLAED